MLKKTTIAAVLILLLLSACQPAGVGPKTDASGSDQDASVNASSTPFQPVTPAATNTPVPTSTPIPTPTATPIQVGPADFSENTNPLTGLQVEDPAILNRRPLMIKVANFPREGRPHAGLSSADIVFDYYIGEGTNRYMAVYYGQDAEKIGPMRSGRLVDAQLTRLYQGVLGFVSADPLKVFPVLYNNLGLRAITQVGDSCPAICDDGPHTVISVFANSAALSQYAASRGVDVTRQNLDGMYFYSVAPSGQPGQQVTLKYNAYNFSQWRYDAERGQYLAWIETADVNNNISTVELTDRNTGEQLTRDNVIILFAPYNELAPTLHEVALWNNAQGKRAVLFRDGQMIEAIWKTPGTDQPIQFFTSDGNPLPLKPGTSWIMIAGENSLLAEQDTAQYELQFRLP
ncbi:MAG: DUF3048 domain-containing protein [Chloroflexi bacterium]|nr:DUF3048 domain-containing protein [Chloroflexota bacterium]